MSKPAKRDPNDETSVRVTYALRKRIKKVAADEEKKIKDLVAELLDEALKRHEQ